MNKITIYHGSVNIVSEPIYGQGKTYNDYGQGFYCTKDLDLAKEWACSEAIDGYVNKYEIDIDRLKILNLMSNEYNVLNWLALLVDNRQVRLSTAISKRGKDYLIDNFLPKYSDYDIIIGYRADDSYFSFVRSFLSNQISLRQLENAMKLGNLGEQFVLKSEKAFKKIKFIDYIVADNSIYYGKRKSRDEYARLNYQKQLENEDIDGIFIRDIIREEFKQNDPRI